MNQHPQRSSSGSSSSAYPYPLPSNTSFSGFHPPPNISPPTNNYRPSSSLGANGGSSSADRESKRARLEESNESWSKEEDTSGDVGMITNVNSTTGGIGSSSKGASGAGGDKDKGAKNRTSRACLNCRRQKMKCEGGDDPPCVRCKASGVECMFRPRANAAVLVDDVQWQETVERRLQNLESDYKRFRFEQQQYFDEQQQQIQQQIQQQVAASTSASFPPQPTPQPHPLHHRSSFSTLQNANPISSENPLNRIVNNNAIAMNMHLPSNAYSPTSTNFNSNMDAITSNIRSIASSTPNSSDPTSSFSPLNVLSSASGMAQIATTPDVHTGAPTLPSNHPVPEAVRILAERLSVTLNKLRDEFVVGGAQTVDMSSLTVVGVLELWMFFHEKQLPLLYGYTLPTSSRPSPLLLSAILTAASFAHPAPHLQALNPKCQHLLELCITQVALRGLRPTASSSSSTASDSGELNDIVGLCVAITWFNGSASGEGGSMLVSMAWRLVLDRVAGLGSSEDTKSIFGLLQLSELACASQRLSQPLISLSAPSSLTSKFRTNNSATSSSPSSPSNIFSALLGLHNIIHVVTCAFGDRLLPSIASQLGVTSSEQLNDTMSDQLGYSDLELLKRSKNDLDDWAKKWIAVVSNTAQNPANSKSFNLNYLVLHYHCARLMVFSVHPTIPSGSPSEESDGLIASRAILQVIATEDDLKDILSCLPSYLVMNIAFSCSMVLDMDGRGNASGDDLLLVESTFEKLSHPTSSALTSTLVEYLQRKITTSKTSPMISTSPSQYQQQSSSSNRLSSGSMQQDQTSTMLSHDFSAFSPFTPSGSHLSLLPASVPSPALPFDLPSMQSSGTPQNSMGGGGGRGDEFSPNGMTGSFGDTETTFPLFLHAPPNFPPGIPNGAAGTASFLAPSPSDHHDGQSWPPSFLSFLHQ